MFENAKEIILKADAILISAGAGMGVDSGLPDFRGRDGFWRAYPMAKELGLSFEELANPRWFKDDPNLAWKFYGHRLLLYRDTTPHDGFYKLLELANSKKYGYFVFTSNVDGQFQKAGFDSDKIVEVHGSIHHLQCVNRCCDDIWSAKNENLNSHPKCPKCNSLARPNILMFGDWEWIENRTHYQYQKLNQWLHDIDKSNLAILEFGAGHSVPTVRMFSEDIARRKNAKLIRVNPRDSDVPNGAISLSLKAKEAIDVICK